MADLLRFFAFYVNNHAQISLHDKFDNGRISLYLLNLKWSIYWICVSIIFLMTINCKQIKMADL